MKGEGDTAERKASEPASGASAGGGRASLRAPGSSRAVVT